jgi:hypothetical protein
MSKLDFKSIADSDKDAVKKKVETLYKRISAKYPDDPALTPPWKDDGKGNRMNRHMKTLAEHYNEAMAEDLLEDWQDVYLCSLTCAMLDAFTIGDSPQSDMAQALDDFKELVLSKFVTQAVETDLSGFLEDGTQTYSYNPDTYAMYNGTSGTYGYMSRRDRMQRKAGRAISAANQAALDDHVSAVKAMAKQAKADMQAHTDSMHDAIDDMAGSGKALALPGMVKDGRVLSSANADRLHGMADKAMSIMADHTKALTGAARDLTSTVYGNQTDSGYDDDSSDDEEKSLKLAVAQMRALHN